METHKIIEIAAALLFLVTTIIILQWAWLHLKPFLSTIKRWELVLMRFGITTLLGTALFTVFDMIPEEYGNAVWMAELTLINIWVCMKIKFLKRVLNNGVK